MVLPANQHGQWKLNGWHFHYQGWTPDKLDQKTFFRDGASQQDLKPLNRRGSVDVDVLKKHACTADRVKDDSFFFYQLLFPLSPPESSGIEDDSQMPYFSHVAILTNVYASISGVGSGMGHEWCNVTVPELVHQTGEPIRHGALDGKAGTIFARWNADDPCYNSTIAESMTCKR